MKLSLLATATLALLLAGPARAQSPAEQLGWTLTVHSYTFQKFSILEAIEKTGALGVSHMSISGSVNLPDGSGKFVKSPTIGLGAHEVATLTAKMREQGIDPTFANLGVVKPGLDEVESRKIFEGAKRLGITVLVAEPEVHGSLAELGPVMDLVEKLAVEYQIKVAIHNHPGPDNFYWQPETVAAAVKGRSPLLGACADVGHWVRSGLDPVESLRKLEGRVLALHFKDLNEPGRKAHDVPWGTGISNARGMLAELQRQKFKGAICVEYEYNWENSSPEIAKSIAWFNRTCAELVAAPAGPELGLQTWTCRNMTFDQVVAFAAKHGVKKIQFIAAHLDPTAAPAESLRKKAVLTAHGLTAYSFGVNRGGLDKEENRRLFEFARLMDMKVIMIEPADLAAWDNLEELVKEYDIRLAIHNHGRGSVYGDPATVKAVLAKRDRRIGVCLDVGWITAAGFDAAAVFRDYGDRVYDLHFNDKQIVLTDGQPVPVDTEIGRGAANYAGLFAAIRKSGWSGVMAIETDSKAFAEDPNRLVSEARGFFEAQLAAGK